MQLTVRRVLISFTLLSIVLLIGLAGAWQLAKQHWHITDIKISGLSLGFREIGTETLWVTQGQGLLQRRVNIEGLRLNREELSLQKLYISLPNMQTTKAAQNIPEDLTQLLPRMAPKSLRIKALLLEVPCQRLRCTLEGALTANVDDQQLNASLDLNHHDEHIKAHLNATLNPVGNIALDIALNGQPKAQLRNTLVNKNWQGELTVEPLPELEWLLPLLANWVPSLSTLPTLPQARFKGSWQMLAPATLSYEAIEHAAFSVAMDLQAPWSVEGLGELSGTLEADIAGDPSNWQITHLQSDLALQQMPWNLSGVDPSRITLKLSPLPAADLKVLAEISLKGAIAATLTGPATLNLKTLSAHLENAELVLTADAYTHNQLTLKKAHAKGLVTGVISRDEVRLRSDSAWALDAKALVIPDFQAHDLSMQLTPHVLTVEWVENIFAYQGQGLFSATSKNLAHQVLKPSAWQWQGNWQLNTHALLLEARLKNAHALQINHSLNYPFQGHAKLTFETRIDGAKQTLPSSLNLWPVELEISQGELNATGTLSFPTFKLNSKGTLTNLSGIYATSEFKELTAPFALDIAHNVMTLTSPAITLKHLNSGIGLGPLTSSARYEATLAHPDKGHIDIHQLSSHFLGGTVSLTQQRLDLAQPQRVNIDVEGIDIEQVLVTYPAEGLSGSGTLDGKLPILVTPAGISIEHGQLTARAPGGHLAFTSEKLTALGTSNPAMKIAADALENFHYHHLSSGVQLSPQGTLNLAFVLKGQNPDVEKGRPINFTINLQEDLPALFKSLQLSGKVSERIEQKVRQQLNQSTGTNSAR